jgi:hypothetical protein
LTIQNVSGRFETSTNDSKR